MTMTVPKWTNTGTVLRLKGKGVPRADGSRGDEYVTLKVVLPEKPDPELEKFVAQWRPASRQPAPGDGGVSMEPANFSCRRGIEAEALEAWIEAGWLVPRAGRGDARSSPRSISPERN